MAWTDNGPVSLPPPRIAYGAGAALVLAALVGVAFGFQGSWRNGSRPSFDAADQVQSTDQAVQAQPIVEIPATQQQAAASATAANSADDDSDDETADSNTIATQTAAAQAAQSRPANGQPDIDQLVTSRSEKPQPAAKPSNDEGAPSDVPF